MLLNEFFDITPLNEGGNMFPDSVNIPKAAAGSVLANLKKALPPELAKQAFATGSAGQKDVSGDMDVMLDNSAVLAWSGESDAKSAKLKLKAALEQAGLKTALSGISVHARVPMGKDFAQVDIMLVDNAATISKLHQHDYAAMGATYKGKHKHYILSSAAKAIKSEKHPNGLMWSAFQGLFSRGPDGKKAGFITNDPDQIAKILLNPSASEKDLASPQSIVAAIPKAERAAKLTAAKADFDKEGIPLPEGITLDEGLADKAAAFGRNFADTASLGGYKYAKAGARYLAKDALKKLGYADQSTTYSQELDQEIANLYKDQQTQPGASLAGIGAAMALPTIPGKLAAGAKVAQGVGGKALDMYDKAVKLYPMAKSALGYGKANKSGTAK